MIKLIILIFLSNCASLFFPTSEISLKGYKNSKGEIIIPPKYQKAGVFINGITLVCCDNEDKYYYINKKGEVAFTGKFDEASDFSEDGFAIVSENDTSSFLGGTKKFIIDTTGKKIINLGNKKSIYSVRNGIYKAEIERIGSSLPKLKYGYFDTKGNLLFKDKCFIFWNDTHRGHYSEGIISYCEDVSDENGYKILWGFYDLKNKKEITKAIYKEIYAFKNGKAIVSKKGGIRPNVEIGAAFGYINIEGKEIIPEKYEYPNNFSHGLALVSDYGKFNTDSNTKKGKLFLNDKNENVFNKYFYDANSFSEDLALVSELNSNTKYDDANFGYEELYFIDLKGEKVLSSVEGKRILAAGSFKDGLALVYLADKRLVFIDKNGVIKSQISENENLDSIHLKNIIYGGSYYEKIFHDGLRIFTEKKK